MAKHRSVRFFMYAAFISSLFLIAYALFHLSQRTDITQSKSSVVLSQRVDGLTDSASKPDGSDLIAKTHLSSTDTDAVRSEHNQIRSNSVDTDLSSPDAALALSSNSSGLHSHLHIDRESSTLPPAFKDEEHHHDNAQAAEELEKNIRVLCWVMTSPDNHQSRAVHVLKTWGKRCTKLLFVSEGQDANLPVVEVKVEHGREHLTAKTIGAFEHLYDHHLDDADWFLKADDDTYVILENLRYFLSGEDPDEPVYFGHHFHVIVQPQGYFSGGAGYVLSREALRRFGRRRKGLCQEDGGAEDVVMGNCMQSLGVRAGDSRDSMNRSRFHCFDPQTHMQGRYPDWYLKWDTYGAKSGAETISDYAISFHYISVEEMYRLEFYIYHLRPYGIDSGRQDLNRPHAPRPSPRPRTPALSLNQSASL